MLRSESLVGIMDVDVRMPWVLLGIMDVDVTMPRFFTKGLRTVRARERLFFGELRMSVFRVSRNALEFSATSKRVERETSRRPRLGRGWAEAGPSNPQRA